MENIQMFLHVCAIKLYVVNLKGNDIKSNAKSELIAERLNFPRRVNQSGFGLNLEHFLLPGNF